MLLQKHELRLQMVNSTLSSREHTSGMLMESWCSSGAMKYYCKFSRDSKDGRVWAAW